MLGLRIRATRAEPIDGHLVGVCDADQGFDMGGGAINENVSDGHRGYFRSGCKLRDSEVECEH